jgi:hypothetical protein
MMVSVRSLVAAQSSENIRRRDVLEAGNLKPKTATNKQKGFEDEIYWERFLQFYTSMPTGSPTQSQTPFPTSAPVLPQTSSPTFKPTSVPTLAPVSPPTEAPVPLPTEAPILPPTPVPTKIPTISPSMVPTAAPFIETTIAPSPLPTPGPTSEPDICVIDLELGCIFGQESRPCEELTPEDQFICTCPECAQELVFIYTASSCDGLDECQDVGTGPGSDSRVLISSLDDSTDLLFSGIVSTGEKIVLNRSSEICIPDSLSVEVFDPATDDMLQIFRLESSCSSQNLELLQSYASLDFMGYSCDSADVHNCMIDVLYEFDACNIGPVNLTLESLLFDLNGDVSEVLPDGLPNDGLVLAPNDCYKASKLSIVEVCDDNEYSAKGVVTGTTEDFGPQCEDQEELNFGWNISTSSPSAVPTLPPPTLSPSANPSALVVTLPPDDTESPSSSPTIDVCDVNLSLSCVTLDSQTNCLNISGEEALECQCSECAKNLIFVYMAQSCDDFDGPPELCVDNLAPTSPARLIITDESRADVFFDAVAEVGDNIKISNGGECLPDSITIAVLPLEDTGVVLQTLTLDTTCDGRDLLTLLNSYGSLDFVGYSCGDLDVHNCFVDVAYLVSTCNENDTENLFLFDLDFDLNGASVDLLGGDSPRPLDPTECFQSFVPSVVERCSEQDYCSSARLNASSTFVGPFCTDEKELKFDTFTNSTNRRLQ